MRSAAFLDRPLARGAAVGLAILLLLLPFHLLIKRALPGPAGTYWKDLIVAAGIGLILVDGARRWALRGPRAVIRRPDLLTSAVLIFAALLILRALTSADRAQAAWGAYFGAGFLPVYLLTVWVLTAADCPGQVLVGKRPATSGFALRIVRVLSLGLVVVGVLVALGGALEFLTDRALVPSREIFERSGFYDMFVFGTAIRRVYFTFDAPTALGHYLTLILPLAVCLLAYPHGPGVLAGDAGEASKPGGGVRPGRWRAAARPALGAALFVLAFALTATFSRAAWIGAVTGLGLLGGGGLVFRDRRLILSVLAGAALFAAGWGSATLIADTRREPIRQAVEISSDVFQRIARGESIDTPDGRSAVVGPVPSAAAADAAEWTIDGDSRTVSLTDPPPAGPGEIAYAWTSFPGRSLVFAAALDPRYWQPSFGDGVRLTGLADSEGQSDTVFSRYLNPKANPADRKWRNFEVDLTRYAGRSLAVRLQVSPEGASGYDTVGWVQPRILSTPIAAGRPVSTAVGTDQLGTISNLGEDSNQDRTAAWLRAIGLWRESPLWGQGVGTTGAATFRAAGGTGFVTESQILKVLAEQGLIGLGSFLAIFGAAAWLAWRTLRSPLAPAERGLVLGIAAAIGTAFVDGLVLQNFEIKQVQLTVWFLLAALAIWAGDRSPGAGPAGESPGW